MWFYPTGCPNFITYRKQKAVPVFRIPALLEQAPVGRLVLQHRAVATAKTGTVLAIVGPVFDSGGPARIKDCTPIYRIVNWQC